MVETAEVVTREDISYQAFTAWTDSGCYGATLVGTGVGKSLQCIKALDYAFHEDFVSGITPMFLWLCSSEQLRDVEAPAEFKKWGYEYLLPHVSFICYQSFYKEVNTCWTMVVCDEGDAALSTEYVKGLLNNHFSRLLFVTATVKEEKKELLESICPIVYKYSTQQAQKDGLLNQTSFILLEVDLSENKDILVEYTSGGVKKSFYTSENAQYEYLEQQFGKLIRQQDIANNQLYRAQMGAGNVADQEKELKKINAQIQRVISQRTTALWTSPTLIRAAKQLTNKVLTTDDHSKVVLFSKRKETAEALGSNVYHSGNKKDNPAIDLFNKGEKRGLSVVDAVNRGVNLVGATHAIFVGFHSSGTDSQQRIGRLVRLPVDDVATCIFLLPYYHTKSGQRKPTQAVKWAAGMLDQYSLDTATRTTLTNYLTL